MNLESLSRSAQFCFLAMMKSAITFKEQGKDEEFFINFAKEIWESMELSGVEYIKDIIDGKMKKDLEPLIENYIKRYDKK